ncbi:MgtC/SapB family protein [Amorphus coralli]|uniref:MgtC/SapB family protein n=1 Tax=Amorphus coralli TaxID=340680 RepID=UPI0004035611|nr:MgtC/SapB family protein [Amorphus coralli]
METNLSQIALTPEMPVVVAVARMGIAALLGAAIGFDQEWRQRSAGLRTHMLVSLAAAVFAILMQEVMVMSLPDHARVDPIRVLEAVTAGVAFLAAGSIIRSGRNVRGITTGAGLWLAGAIGAATGLGLVWIAAVAAGFALVIIVALRVVDRQIEKVVDKDPPK